MSASSLNNCLIIGSGSIAKKHAQVVKEEFPLCVVAVTPSRDGKVIKPNDFPNIDRTYIDLAQALEHHWSLVIVASPAPCHLKHLQAIAKVTDKILMEKPLASELSDAIQMQEIAPNAALGYCLRCLPEADIVKHQISQKTLGKILNVQAEVGQYLPSWRPDSDYRESVSANAELGGGALLELSHEIDLLRYLIGDLTFINGVIQYSGSLAINVEDKVQSNFKAGQTLVSVSLDFLQHQVSRVVKIVGERATLVWDLVAKTVTITDEFGYVQELNPKSDETRWLMYRRQLHAVINGSNRIANFGDGRQVIELIDKMKHQSSVLKAFE